MMDLIKNLKYHFRDRLQTIEWLDNHTKNAARELFSTSLYEIVTADEISQIIEREGIYNSVSRCNEWVRFNIPSVNRLASVLSYRLYTVQLVQLKWHLRSALQVSFTSF